MIEDTEEVMIFGGCGSCSFCHLSAYEDEYCKHPTLPAAHEGIDLDSSIEGSPTWCPLRERSIEVSLAPGTATGGMKGTA